jgi:hypothetical protein
MSAARNTSLERPLDFNQNRGRDVALDFVKGILVLVMVFYHWANYFVGLNGIGYLYIRFITPSFVFLSGFVVTSLLATAAGKPDSLLIGRLLGRALKLVVVLTLLNLLVGWLEPTRPSGRLIELASFIENWPGSYLTGEGVTFSVLLPISYTLALAGLLLAASGMCRIDFWIATSILIAAWSIIALWGVKSSVFQLVGAGLFGLIVGSALANRMPWLRCRWPWLVLAYVLHLGALTIWGVPYPLQLVSVCVNLWFFYRLAHLLPPAGSIVTLATLLGRYTLMGYLGQIAILQVLAIGLHRLDLGRAKSTVALVAVLGLTTLLIVAIDWLRRRIRVVDSLYRFVFA